MSFLRIAGEDMPFLVKIHRLKLHAVADDAAAIGGDDRRIGLAALEDCIDSL
jgi:hypothetical protein